MSKHLRVLVVFRDGRVRTTQDVYRAIPRDSYLGDVCKDLARDGCLERVGVDYRITEAGRARLARSTPIGARS